MAAAAGVVRRVSAAALLVMAAVAVQAQEAIRLERPDRHESAATAYRPTAACRGVAIVSPGAGGSEQGYRYLGRALSDLGYLTVVTGHRESGPQALRDLVRQHGIREGLAVLITEPAAYRGRFMDIDASRRWARSRCEADASVLVGHSMGAATAMLEAGARNQLGLQGGRAFGAYIALSPQGTGTIFPAKAWSDITSPTLLITGTRDTELGGGSWRKRTEPFADLPAGCKWLGVIDGATHMNFAGHGASGSVEALTVRLISAFLEGVRRGDCSPPPPVDGIELSAG